MFIKNAQLRTSYDSIIIGSGLSGLLIANALERNGQTTLLIDSHPEGQSTTRHLGVEVVPNNPANETLLNFLQASINEEFDIFDIDAPAVTFEAGFKPFVGFGEQNPAFSEEIPFYTSTGKLKIGLPLEDILAKLTERYAGHHMAGFKPSHIHTENNQVLGISINGGRKITCTSLIYCDHPQNLTNLISQDQFQKKTLRALSKSNLWTSLSWDLFHEIEVTQEEGMHVLMPNKDKTEPCWGGFLPLERSSQNDAVIRSQWMSLMPTEQAVDTEHLASVLKKIQKQVKRAYPEIGASIAFEKITVHPASHGQIELPLTGHQTLPEFENLWVGSQHAHTQRNLAGLLGQVCLVLTALGFPIETEVQTEIRAEIQPGNDGTEIAENPVPAEI